MSLRRIRFVGFFFSLFLGMASFAVQSKDSKGVKAISGEYIVKLRDQVKDHSQVGLMFQQIARQLEHRLGQKGFSSVKVDVRLFKTSDQFAVFAAKGADHVISLLMEDARISYAEPNYLYHALIQSAPAVNDARYAELWGIENGGQADAAGQVGKTGSDIHVVPVWNEGVTGNRSVKVAVIDTGVDYNHEDLKDNILINAAEIPGDGIDNDGNGFVDDVYGWNFSENTANGMDDHNHGTHCAGTIGALGNNQKGVVGVNWNVSILPVKFLSASGSGSLEGAVQAIQYATRMGVNIMSNSWGGGPYSQALYDAIDEARKKGILFVAAAGNDSNDNDSNPSYPASYELDNVLSVAATDNRDQIAGFSNFGRTKVHVAAPGVKILSTVRNNGYAVFSGTSMATPHVSGIAALLLSANPSLTYSELKTTLIASSDKVRGLSKKVIARGRVNVYNAIHGITPSDPAPAENLWKDRVYTIESPHPYQDNKNYSYSVQVPSAKFIRLIFDSIDTEAGYDKISIRDASGDEIESLSGSYSNYVSDYVPGSSATLNFKTDASVNKNGFKITKIQIIE